MNPDNTAVNIRVRGIVQGVGFRPFVFQLAQKHSIKGRVSNTSKGVFIKAAASRDNIASFTAAIEKSPPPLSKITSIEVEDVDTDDQNLFQEYVSYQDFAIDLSHGEDERNVLISPDVSICEDCLEELFCPDDRRYRHPFINCTNCGPRYTIIKDVPYDRQYTSMKDFKMCRDCQAEYDDPANRRFHAQPDACPVCGPQLTLFDQAGVAVKCIDPVEKTISLLKNGCIVAIKGLGGFHLAVDAMNNKAVIELRKRKKRDEKPFALMAPDIETAREFAVIENKEKALLLSRERPIVILQKRLPNTVADFAAPKNRYFGVFLPYTPLHYLILRDNFTALVMTSGNISDEPIAIDNGEAFTRLSGIADYFLAHDRDIYLRSDDSIIRYTAESERFVRRSRGYVPVPVFLDKDIPQVLATGAELKNTICLTKEDKAFVSQHIGDMENLETYNFFLKTISHMERILGITPDLIACDMHPDYMSTGFAQTSIKESKAKKLIQVQHHHAHIAACLAENRVDGPVIGLAFDGTGYGIDGKIWGGEVLVADYKEFKRAAHLVYTPMPGGAAAIKAPQRMGISFLYSAFGRSLVDMPVLTAMLNDEMDEKDVEIILQMIEKGVNSPMTSSMGRLFEGVAAILGIRGRNSFEGQAAIELEMIADPDVKDYYDLPFSDDECIKVFVPQVIQGIVKDIEMGKPVEFIAGKFHRTIILTFTKICEKISERTSIKSAALSGGVFQNAILLSGFITELEKKGFEVYTHSLVPANDGGISLGQAVIAGASFL